jgi:hypothetical protein
MNDLDAFLRLWSDMFKRSDRRGVDLGALLLQHGRVFEQPTHGRFTPRPRQCFQRAYEVSQRVGSPYVYCEGYALHRQTGIPVHHGWVVRRDARSRVIELAWDDPGGSLYRGICFQRDFVRKTFHAAGRRSYSVLDFWSPLLRGDVQLADVIERDIMG